MFTITVEELRRRQHVVEQWCGHPIGIYVNRHRPEERYTIGEHIPPVPAHISYTMLGDFQDHSVRMLTYDMSPLPGEILGYIPSPLILGSGDYENLDLIVEDINAGKEKHAAAGVCIDTRVLASTTNRRCGLVGVVWTASLCSRRHVRVERALKAAESLLYVPRSHQCQICLRVIEFIAHALRTMEHVVEKEVYGV